MIPGAQFYDDLVVFSALLLLLLLLFLVVVRRIPPRRLVSRLLKLITVAFPTRSGTFQTSSLRIREALTQQTRKKEEYDKIKTFICSILSSFLSFPSSFRLSLSLSHTHTLTHTHYHSLFSVVYVVNGSFTTLKRKNVEMAKMSKCRNVEIKMSKWFFTRPFLFDFDARLGFRRSFEKILSPTRASFLPNSSSSSTAHRTTPTTIDEKK